MVSFGTSVEQARKCITAVENALRDMRPDMEFRRAFTSPTIRRILAKRGEEISSPEEELVRLAREGFETVYVQPTHMIPGIEFDKLKNIVHGFSGRFECLRLGKPLLAEADDLPSFADILMRAYPRQDGEALVLMGHGTEHFANAIYPALQSAFSMSGREDIFVGTVEGWPRIEDIRSQLVNKRCKRAHLVPMMLVAGDHAVNDMAGDEPESWKSVLEAAGIEVRCTMQGLGANEDVQRMYGEHLKRM